MEIKANVYFEDSTGRYEYDINVNDIVKLKNLVIGIKKRHFKTKFNFLISFNFKEKNCLIFSYKEFLAFNK